MTTSTVVLITLLCVLIAMNIYEFVHLSIWEAKQRSKHKNGGKRR